MPQIQRITTDDPLYPLACDLRERVLLAPIGYSFDRYKTEYPGVEQSAHHFVASADTPGGPRVFACGLLIPQPNQIGKVAQVAVDPQRQGEGLGRAVMSSIEACAFGRLALTRLMCHAQVTAIGFYDRLGWMTDSEDFLEAGIIHRRMIIDAPKLPSTPPEIPAW